MPAAQAVGTAAAAAAAVVVEMPGELQRSAVFAVSALRLSRMLIQREQPM
jgi:hypothetical protein